MKPHNPYSSCNFVFLSSLTRTSLLFVCAIIIPYLGMAQRDYPDMSTSISSNGSDYDISFSYSGAIVVACIESLVHTLAVYKNTDASSYTSFNGTGSVNSGSFALAVGLNLGASWGLRYSESEDCPWVWCNCVAWVWSGFPRANSSDDRGPGQGKYSQRRRISDFMNRTGDTWKPKTLNLITLRLFRVTGKLTELVFRKIS